MKFAALKLSSTDIRGGEDPPCRQRNASQVSPLNPLELSLAQLTQF